MESHEKDLRSEVEDEAQVDAIHRDYRKASLSSREMALLDYAVKLTKGPRRPHSMIWTSFAPRASMTINLSMRCIALGTLISLTGCSMAWESIRSPECGIHASPCAMTSEASANPHAGVRRNCGSPGMWDLEFSGWLLSLVRHTGGAATRRKKET